MGVWYQLVNQTKREIVCFHHVSGMKAREIAGNPASASMVAWYLLQNSGNAIAFLTDELGEWPFQTGCRGDESSYHDVTDRVIKELVAADILRDDGIAWADDEEPETCFIRAIRNVWPGN